MDDYLASKDGAMCWHFDKIPFNEEIKKLAEVELNETAEVTHKAIEELKAMITENTEFTTRTDDAFLLRYLRARKFDCKRAYKLLRNYCLSTARYPAILEDFRPSAIKDYIFRNVYTILPYRDPEGRVIAVFRFGEVLPERTPISITLRIAIMSLEMILQHPVTQVTGLVNIIDFREVTIRFFTYAVTPSNIRIVFNLLQDCFPGRLKRHHIVFGPIFFKLAYAAAKLFIREKMRQRIVFHGNDMKSLHEYIPPEILPEEYGGTLDLDRNQWPERLLSMEQYFIDLRNDIGKRNPVE